MNRVLELLRDESGAVTVDWVVLTAGVVVIAMLIAPALSGPIHDLAEYIGLGINESGDMISPD